MSAQTSSDFSKVNLLFADEEQTSTSSVASIKKDKNEFQLTQSMFFAIYSNLISSQDGTRCRFYPTCSGYCRQAIIKNGLVLGMIQGLDRLTRCNGLSANKYKIDFDRKRLIDHVH